MVEPGSVRNVGTAERRRPQARPVYDLFSIVLFSPVGSPTTCLGSCSGTYCAPPTRPSRRLNGWP